jgi:rod shape-determining protein MreC
MLLSRRARELTLSVLLFAVPVVLLYGNIGHPSRLNLADRAMLRISGQLQRLVHGTLGGVGDLWEHYVALWDLEQRNARLRARNFELRENNKILRKWSKRGRELEAQLGFAVTPPLRTHPADVVGRAVSPFYRVVRARVRPGLHPRPGQPVAVPAGLVGHVRRVSGRFVDVLRVGDVQSRVKVMIKRTASRGELRGTGRPGLLRGRVEYLSRRDTVRVGDRLVTSGMAGRYPRDLPVGRVVAVHERIKMRYQVVEVAAAVGARIPPTVHLIPRPPRRPKGR